MQKLVTIACYANHTIGGPKIKHGEVEHHLITELAAGWKVVSITAVGSAGGAPVSSGWLAVLLEKSS